MLCEAGRSQSQLLKQAATLLKGHHAHSPFRAAKVTLGFKKSSAGVKVTLLIAEQKNVFVMQHQNHQDVKTEQQVFFHLFCLFCGKQDKSELI